MLEEKQKIKLANIFSNFPKVKAVYLFGSHAENKENRYSDLDLGILLEDNFDKMIKVDLLVALTEHNFNDIDLVLLNNASPLVSFEVVKHNKIIYKRDDFDSNSYFSLTVRKFLDFRPYLQIQRRYLKERILNGQV